MRQLTSCVAPFSREFGGPTCISFAFFSPFGDCFCFFEAPPPMFYTESRKVLFRCRKWVDHKHPLSSLFNYRNLNFRSFTPGVIMKPSNDISSTVSLDQSYLTVLRDLIYLSLVASPDTCAVFDTVLSWQRVFFHVHCITSRSDRSHLAVACFVNVNI